MKEGWEYIALSSVCRVQNGFAFDSKLFNDSNNGLPLIRIRDIKRGYSLTYTDETCSDDFFVEDGDMLIGMDGDFNIGEWKGGRALLNQRVCKLIPSEKILAKFIFYFIPEALKRINDKTAFSTVKHLSSKQVNAIQLPNISLSEQQRIVDYLNSAFAKIDAMKANAEKSLNEAKALFQASLKEMLEPKEGWEEKKLGEVGTFIRGGNFSKKDFIEDGFPCVHYGQIHTKFGVATYNHLSCVPNNMVKKERCASKGDLIIAITSEDDEGSCKCTAWMADYEAYVGGHTAIFKHILNPLFVSYYFKASRFQKAKLEYTHGFKVVEISPKDIAKIPISYPPLSEQQTIVATLDSLKSKVDRLQANFEKISQECDALKQAILRQVFE